ncbi:MAG: polysaccharide deacetylase family protein [Patescibacteria group bacterium]|nr:polysaccharide deacetylase family protein [Patescibacteria group bacterium]
MAEFNLKMIKIFFVVVIAMLILAMTSGMNILRGDKFSFWQKLKMEADFIKYKRALAAQEPDASRPNSGPETRYAKSIPALLYHGIITNRDWKEDGTNITLEIFWDQMLALKRAGYHTITLSEFSEYMQKKRDLPDKSILITFDDGRKDSYYEADPILRALDYNAVMFLITGRSLGKNSAGDNFYLGSRELEEMIKSKRWEIQSHGDFDHDWMQIDPAGNKGHFMSNLLWLPAKNRNETADEAKKRILADLESSKKKIDGELGQKVVAFAYPFNDFGQNESNFPEAKDFIAENISKIYPLTFYQEELSEPIVNFPKPDNFMIRRINVDSSFRTDSLLELLAENREKTLPWSDTFWNNSGWRTKWGSMKIWGDLVISEEEERGGNSTLLLGSSLWKDYSVRSKVRLTNGTSVSQVVRYENEENYAVCNFDTTEISVSQKINGKSTVVAAKPGDYGSLPGADHEIGAEVRGNTISCSLDGKNELEGKLDSSLATGGIGYYIWDDIAENAVVSIKKVDVFPL